MVKRVPGALYKKIDGDSYFKKGTILKLNRDDGSRIPGFTDGEKTWYLILKKDVKLLKPKKGDTVRLISKKHTTKELSWDDDMMEDKGSEFTLLHDIDLDDDTFLHDCFWYHKKDLAVIKRPGVDF